MVLPDGRALPGSSGFQLNHRQRVQALLVIDPSHCVADSGIIGSEFPGLLCVSKWLHPASRRRPREPARDTAERQPIWAGGARAVRAIEVRRDWYYLD